MSYPTQHLTSSPLAEGVLPLEYMDTVNTHVLLYTNKFDGTQMAICFFAPKVSDGFVKTIISVRHASEVEWRSAEPITYTIAEARDRWKRLVKEGWSEDRNP